MSFWDPQNSAGDFVYTHTHTQTKAFVIYCKNRWTDNDLTV